MVTIIGVRFKKVGKIYYFDPRDLTVKPGDHVIVETARGIECGVCATGNAQVEKSRVVSQLKPIIRIATPADLQVARTNERQAREAHAIARRKIEEHKLDMRLVTVECTFDLNKILFYFTAEGRVDFRDLVKDLASIFRTRIELRQIGVRDEAKMIGGLGICGRELCCASYLEDFAPVSINMAKEQNLSLNPAKISGTCGRLMCCLKYEYEAYVDLQKHTPKNESLVDTPDGTGTVLSSQLLRSLVRVRLDNDPENPRIYHCDDLEVLRNGRAKKNGAAAVPSRPATGRPRRSDATETAVKADASKRNCSHKCGTCSNNCPSKTGGCPAKSATPEINPLIADEPVAVGMPPKGAQKPRRNKREDGAKREDAPRRESPKREPSAKKEAPAPRAEKPQNDTPRMVSAPKKDVKPAKSEPVAPKAPAKNETPRMVSAPKKDAKPAVVEAPAAPVKPQADAQMPRLVRAAPKAEGGAVAPKKDVKPAKSEQPRRVMAAPKHHTPAVAPAVTSTITEDGEQPITAAQRFRRPNRNNNAADISITPAETIRVEKSTPASRPVRDLTDASPQSTPESATDAPTGEVKKRRKRRGGSRNKNQNANGEKATPTTPE